MPFFFAKKTSIPDNLATHIIDRLVKGDKHFILKSPNLFFIKPIKIMQQLSKIIFSLAIIIGLAPTLSAQSEDTQVGLRAGLNFHGMSGADTKGDIGIAFGIWGHKKLNNWLGWQAELLYLEQGGARNVDVLGFDVTAEFNIDYITLPIMATFHPLDFLSLQAGIQPGFAIKKETLTSSLFSGPQVGELEDINSFEAAMLFGLNVKVPYWNGNWGFTAQYRRGLTNIYAGPEDISINNRGFALSATYTVPLSDLLGN